LQVHLPLKLRAAIQAKTKEGSTSDTKRLMTAAMPSPRPTQVKVRTFGERFEALVIGVSTGGPDALAEVIPKLSGHLPVPVFLVQHMPASFITAFADRLDELSELSVHQADEGAAPQAGQVYIAPGDQHMVLEPGADVRIRLQQTPPENGCRPAVDPLFRTAAEVYGDACLALILTGMGHDGLAGSRALQGKGATIIAQDEISSVVWGMPGAVVGAGLASEILPLDEIAPRLSLLLNRGAARA
jgi:two-component system chemotaxis response regulator CheB